MDKLNNFLNVKSSISPISILLFVQIIIISHFFQSDMSRKLKEYVESNTLLKQLIIFLTILTIISQIYKSQDIKTIILYSVIIYLLTLLVDKTNYKLHIVLFIVLAIYHLYEIHITNKEEQLRKDPQLTSEYKQKVIEKNDKIRKYSYAGFILLILAGSLFQESDKKNMYGGNFNLNDFLFQHRNKIEYNFIK
jgi:membrane-associated HD superfamily phosphohydrolase